MALYPCTNNEIDSLINGSIKKINSNVTIIKPFAFANCAALTDINFPNVTTLPQGCFQNCSSLKNIDLHNITSFSASNIFYNCSTLEEAIIYSISNIPTGTFNNCINFKTLVIKNQNMASLQTTQAFGGTQFGDAGNGGKLYVPQSLIATYQANQNWSDLLALNANNQILAIESSPYED